MVNYLQTVQSFVLSVHYRVGQFQTFFNILCICMLFAVPLGTIGEMPNFWPKTRVGNSLIGFLSKLLIFWEQKSEKVICSGKERKSDLLGKRANCSHCYFVKSDGNNLLFA